MRILSFNIWDIPLWFVKDRQKRLDGVLRYILGQESDIVCLQESFDLNHRRALFAQLQAHGYHITEGSIGSRPHWLSRFCRRGGLVIFSRFPIIATSFVPFKRILRSSLIEFIAGKGLLKALIQTPHGNIQVLTTHLHFLNRTVRLQQMAVVLAELRKDPAMPTVLAGDFNEHDMVNDPEFGALLEAAGFTHPSSAHEPTYRSANAYAFGRSRNTVFAKQIDYILVKHMDTLGLESSQYHPHYIEPPLSDHEPVVMTLMPPQASI